MNGLDDLLAVDVTGTDQEGTAQVSPSADIDTRARIGPGVTIWHLCQVREHAQIGTDTIIGRGVYIGPGVIIGPNCKVQNYALIYEPSLLENGVFVGPGVVFTNDLFPRAINVDGTRKTNNDWNSVGVTVRTGASIGAMAVCVAPLTIGRWSLIAAGSVVTKDVLEFAMVAGVPAKRIGWVGRAGFPLEDRGEGSFVCPKTGEEYVETAGVLSQA